MARKGSTLVCVPCGREVVITESGSAFSAIWCCGIAMEPGPAAPAGKKLPARKKAAKKKTPAKKTAKKKAPAKKAAKKKTAKKR